MTVIYDTEAREEYNNEISKITDINRLKQKFNLESKFTRYSADTKIIYSLNSVISLLLPFASYGLGAYYGGHEAGVLLSAIPSVVAAIAIPVSIMRTKEMAKCEAEYNRRASILERKIIRLQKDSANKQHQ